MIDVINALILRILAMEEPRGIDDGGGMFWGPDSVRTIHMKTKS